MARSIIQDLITEGACVLYSDYRSGSVYDYAKGTRHPSTMTDCHFNGAGVQFLSSGKISITDSLHTLELTTGTIIVFGKFDNVDSGTLVHKEDGGGRNYKFGFTSSTELFFKGRYSSGSALTISAGKSCHAVSFISGSDPVGYTDGIYVGDYDNAITVATNDAPLLIGHEFESVEGIQGCTISAVIICNRVLTATEHAQVYGELAQKKWPKSQVTKSTGMVKTSTNDTSLISYWDFKPVNNTIRDLGYYGNTLTKSKGGPVYCQTALGPAMYFDGVDDYLYTATEDPYKRDTFTISCWIKPEDLSATFSLFGLASSHYYVGVASPNRLIFYTRDSAFGSDTDYSSNDVLILGEWQHVVFTCSTNGSNVTKKIYLNNILKKNITHTNGWYATYGTSVGIATLNGSSSFFKGWMSELKYYSDAKDPAWVQKEYEKGLTALSQTNFGIRDEHQNVTDDIYPFSQIGGAHNIKSENLFTVAPGGSNILDNAVVKALWCQTPGYILISGDRLGQTPTECAYGTWDFWLFFALDSTSTVSIHLFLDDAANGYRLHFDEMGICSLFRFDSGVDTSLFVSASPVAIELNSWVHMIIKRDISGAFYIYSSNILYNGMTLLAAASGSNPIIDATYKEAKYNYVIALTYDGASPLMNAISLGDSSGNYGLVKKILS